MAKDPIDRPTSEEIYNLLAYSNDYYLDDVDFGDIQVYINEIEDDIYLPHCYSCENRIKYTETIFYSGYPFHKDCVKCIVCNKSLKTNQNIDEFVCITNGIFFCKPHYNSFKNTHQLPPNIMAKIKSKCKQNVIDDLFNIKIQIINVIDDLFNIKIIKIQIINHQCYWWFKSNFFNDVDVLNQNPNNVFITFDMVENSYQNHKPYMNFIPNITFHFERFSEKIDFNKLEKVFQKDMIIIGIDLWSTILKTAYLSMKKLDKSSKAELEALISRVKKYLLTPEWKSAIGKLIEEPKIEYPDDEKIKNIYNNNLSNALQDSDSLNNSQIEDLKKEVLIHLQNERNNRNLALISLIQSMFIPIQK